VGDDVNDHQRYTALRKPRICPACGKANVVKILYGMPIATAFEDAAAGRIVLGGCVITGDDPSWQCLACSADIYRAKPKGSGDAVPT
jgi:hypothetical protein